MSKCPSCGKEIEFLMFERIIGSEGFFFIDKFGDEKFQQVHVTELENAPIRLLCPECEKVLFDDPYDAIEFLHLSYIDEEYIDFLINKMGERFRNKSK